MKIMNRFNFSDIIAGITGLFSGGIAYINFYILGINWNNVGEQFLQLLWSLLVAALTTAVGVIVKKKMEKHWLKIESLFKKKNKK